MASNAKGQGEHVVDELLDYLRGSLSSDRREQIRAHLDGCDECAADYRFGEQFRAQVASVREAHVEAHRLVELASESGPEETPSEKFHLRVCVSCREEWELLRALPDVEELSEPTEADMSAARHVNADSERAGNKRSPRKSTARPSPRSMRRRWIAAAAAASLVVVAFFQSRPGSPEIPFPDPIPVRTLRDVPDDGSFEYLYNEGLALYEQRDYGAAAERFKQARTLDANDGTLLVYSASALLFAEAYDQAAALASEAAAIAGNERMGREAAWIRAHALYRAGETRAARKLFEAEVAEKGTHAEEAERILRAIDDD